MRRIFHVTLMATISTLASVAGALSPEPYNVTWDSPSKDCHGSMPLGNGATSLNAWVDPDGELVLYIGRTDSWGDNARLLKVGRVRVSLDPAPSLDLFEQTLSLVDATMVVRYGEGDAATILKLWADANRPVIHVTVDAPEPVTATAAIDIWRTERCELPSLEASDVMAGDVPEGLKAPTIVEPDTILKNQTGRIGWYHRNTKSVGPALHAEVQDVTGYDLEDPLLHRTFGAIITGPDAKRVDDSHLRSPEARQVRFDIYVDTLHPATEQQWLDLMDGHIASVGSADFAMRRKEHDAWWLERWNRSWIMAEMPEGLGDPDLAIPPNAHPVRLGTDQYGGSGLAGDLGRVSLIGRPLSGERIAALAASAPDQALDGEKDVLFSATAPATGPIAESSAWRFADGLTMESWVRPATEGAGNGRLFDKITPGQGDGFLLDALNGLRLIVGNQQMTHAAVLPAGKWSHVAAVIPAGEAPPRLYLNGEPVAEGEALTPEQKRVRSMDEALVVSRAYALQRFIDICQGRGAYAIKFNGAIFNVPNEGSPGDADYRRWGPGYWWQNTRLPYFSMCTSGDIDLTEALFKQYIDEFLPLNRYRTKHYFGFEGAYYIECVHFWGDAFNNVYGWTPPADEREDKLQVSEWHKWEWVCGPELLYMALDRFDHTGDVAFLKQRVFPTAEAIMGFFEGYYETGPDGKLVMHPSQAVETWWECTNPMPEVAGLIAITDRLLALDDSLTLPEERERWKSFRKKLPELPTREIEGKTAFAPAEKFDQKRNCENPELYCVFPFRLASFNRPNAEAAVNALDHRWDRGNSGWRQDDIFMAYLGLTDQARAYLVGRARNHDKGSRFPAFWGPNYDWTPDQTHGGVLMKAFQAMLMQAEPYTGSEYDGRIYLLPAWPKQWNVQFKLHAPRDTVLEGEYRDGKMVRLEVTPESRRKDVVIVE